MKPEILKEFSAVLAQSILQWSESEEVPEEIGSAPVANYLIGLLPESLGSRVKDNQEVSNLLGIKRVSTINCFDGHTILADDLLGATRRLTEVGSNEAISTLERGTVEVIWKPDGLSLELVEGTERARRRALHLELLLPDSAVRESALESLLAPRSASAFGLSDLPQVVRDRPLAESEVSELVETLGNSVFQTQSSIKDAINHGSATIDQICPADLSYYDHFCGPDPEDYEPDSFLAEVVVSQRKAAIARHLVSGLETSLLGFLRDDLNPGGWLESATDDELFEAIGAVDPFLDPFSLLGALDLAAYRLHDERLAALALEAVDKLTDSAFFREDGIDVYVLLPLFARLVSNRLAILDATSERPPHWRRLCTWMQATFLVRATHELSYKLEDLQDFQRSQMTLAGELRNLLDFSEVPMHASYELFASPVALRNEILGQLAELVNRHRAEGRILPLSEQIEEVLESASPLLAWAQPGPLEGHRRPSAEEKPLPAQLGQGTEDLGTAKLSAYIAYFSQLFNLQGSLLGRLASELRSDDYAEWRTELNIEFATLAHSGIAAVACRDTVLANSAADVLISDADKYQSSNVEGAVRTLVWISTAFKESVDQSDSWLEDAMVRLARRLPPGEPSAVFWTVLQELKVAQPAGRLRLERAEAIAAQAF